MKRELWRLSDRIIALLGAEIGLTEDDLAVRTGASRKDIRTVVAILIRQHRADRCAGYVVAMTNQWAHVRCLAGRPGSDDGGPA